MLATVVRGKVQKTYDLLVIYARKDGYAKWLSMYDDDGEYAQNMAMYKMLVRDRSLVTHDQESQNSAYWLVWISIIKIMIHVLSSFQFSDFIQNWL